MKKEVIWNIKLIINNCILTSNEYETFKCQLTMYKMYNFLIIK